MTADTLPLDDGCRLVPHVAPAPARRKPPVLVSRAPRPPSHLHILFRADVPKGYDRLCDEAVLVPTVLEKLDLLETIDDPTPVAPSAPTSFDDLARSAGEPDGPTDAATAPGGPLPVLPVFGPPGDVGGRLPVLTGTVPPVPEPATWLTMAAGLGFVVGRRLRTRPGSYGADCDRVMAERQAALDRWQKR